MGTYNAGEVELGLRVNTKEYDRQINGIRKIAAKTAKTMAAAFTVKAAVNFGKQCLELGSDLQEVQNVVDTVFPNMEEKVNKFAKNAAASYGLSETMAKKYAGTFGAMADAFGFAEKESYNMATALTGLAGDVASFYNITQDEAYTKLKSVFTGETESLKDLGVVMTQAALDQYALANGFGKTTAAMTEQEKVALRYAFVQSQLSNAAGDFAKTSGSWANQVRYLSLQMESFKASIGQGLINVLTPVIRWLNTLMSKLVGAANAFKKFTETLTGKKSQPITLKETSNSVDSVTSGADNASDALGKTAKKVKALKRELAGFDQIAKLGEASSNSGTSGTSSSTGSVGAIDTPNTAGEAGKVEKLTQKYKALGKAVDKLKKSFKGFTEVIGSGLKWAYNNILKPLGKWTIKKYLPAVIEALASAFDFLTAVLKTLAPVFKILWDVIKPVFKLLGKLLLFNIKNLTKGFRIFANILKKHVVPLTEKLYKGWKKLLKTAKELPKRIKEIPEKIKEWFAGKIEGAEEWFSGIKDAFYNMLSSLAEDLPDLSEVASAASERIGEIKAKIVAWFADKKEDLANKWNDITANVREKIVELKARIETKAEEIKAAWDERLSNWKNKTADLIANAKTTAKAIKTAWDERQKEWKGKKVNFLINFTTTLKAVKAKIAALKAAWTGKTAKFALKFTAAVSDLKKWVNTNVIDKVNSKFKKVPILKNHLIPHLAQGGYVKKNTPQLAMIGDNRHQGEIVAPENKLLEMARMAVAGSGGRDAEIVALLKDILTFLKMLDLEATVEGDSLMRLVVKLINQKTKSTGQCPIKI